MPIRTCRLRWARRWKCSPRFWRRAESEYKPSRCCKPRCEPTAILQFTIAVQKNLNLLSLQGKVAPTLKSDEFLGARLPAAAQLKGEPVLLFFWAHWCGDCKAEAPIITQLRSEFAGKGLQVIGPTRLYGYTAQIEHASASDELQYIDAVRHRFYSGLLDMPVPISRYNLDLWRFHNPNARAAGPHGKGGDVPSGGATV